ncbi:uncharacterized protein LOC116307439 [Actinia tenebrosa]|uniref:Uncharacterized protein LOC116307439 n=1 Tax=Actinia tenebrosa TaxID=6105 RepID=A0A6P8J1Z9_ACTTE|nr:uncharacterized protein LOC116307439 [Actinia tenebrosa]
MEHRGENGFFNLRKTFLLFIITLFVTINCGNACDTDGDLTSPCPSDQASLCKNGKCDSRQRLPHTQASLAAVISVCSILMLCFWGLLCFACYKQCKECNGGYPSEFSSSSINSITLDFTSIDIPDDFVRNARIPSVEEYAGPPPYLCLFNPMRDKNNDSYERSKTQENRNCAQKKNSISEDVQPPNYKALFANGPPDYHEVACIRQTTVA